MTEEKNNVKERIEDIEKKLREIEHLSSIQIGDLSISTNKGSLKECKAVAREIIEDKKLNDYLCLFFQKKLSSSSFIG